MGLRFTTEQFLIRQIIVLAQSDILWYNVRVDDEPYKGDVLGKRYT